MICSKCKGESDADALYCEHCGAGLTASAVRPGSWTSRILLGALTVLVVAAVAAIGYYKFFLPRGIAAVVNGEEITLAEVDAQMQGFLRNSEVPPQLLDHARYRVLNDLITERVAWQEAERAGIRASGEDIDAAYGQLAAAAGSDRAAFGDLIKAQYGSVRSFRRSLERRITISKYIAAKITAGISDPTIAGARVDQWLQDISGRASVRVALAEQLPGSGAACGTGCSSGGCPAPGAANGGCGSAPRTGADASPQATAARKAALTYWHQRYGSEPVETRVLDYGCHIQVDMLQGKKIAKSLRYQNGTITEM
jgi:hypothetical protein